MRRNVKKAQYQKKYRRNLEMRRRWGKCEACGDTDALIILTEKEKKSLSLKEIRETRVLCSRCLLKDQPLLRVKEPAGAKT